MCCFKYQDMLNGTKFVYFCRWVFRIISTLGQAFSHRCTVLQSYKPQKVSVVINVPTRIIFPDSNDLP